MSNSYDLLKVRLNSSLKVISEVFFLKAIFKNFAIILVKHPCQNFSFDTVAGFRLENLSKRRPSRSCFLVNFSRFLKAPFLQNSSKELLLCIINFVSRTDSSHKIVIFLDVMQRLLVLSKVILKQLSIYLSIYLSIDLSIYLSIYLYNK